MRALTRVAVAVALTLSAAAAPASAAGNPWLRQRVLDMAHQGGENELPSNTMYAFERAVAAGADTLELDVNATKDGRLVVMHDWKVDRTTNGTGYLAELTLAQVRRLDAAYRFVPGRNAVTGLPAARYPLRGVRTGERRPPRGFHADDLRVPTLAEVLRAFPRTPVNIEIKGRDDDPAQFRRGAELLAAELRSTRRRDLIVVSFDQAAVDRFHQLLPRIAVAPGIAGTAAFLLGGGSPGPGVAALQLPITYTLDGRKVDVTTPESVLKAHRAGYAVHVWLSDDEENAKVYDRLLDMCVDGIMAAEPMALERRLQARDVVRAGGHGTDPCSVRAAGAARAAGGSAVTVALARRGLGPQAYHGSIELIAARGPAALLARGRFELAEGVATGEAKLALTAAGRAALNGARRVKAVAAVTTRGAAGEPVTSTVSLR